MQQRSAGACGSGRRRGVRCAARAGCRKGRRLPLGESRALVDPREQLQLASDVLQPAARRPEQRKDDLRRRPSGREITGRRQDLRDARRSRRLRRARARRPARDLDRSEEWSAHHGRKRRRSRHQLGPGKDVGLREHHGDRSRVLGHGRHASPVFPLHRLAGQRELGRPERHARRSRHHEQRLVRDRWR